MQSHFICRFEGAGDGRKISKDEMLRSAQHDKKAKFVGWALPTDSFKPLK